ncbi:hypothetical protein QYF36_021773 [Acer negundo]|nr:hypothetical protein QYF36_021773 [Acer negundo]
MADDENQDPLVLYSSTSEEPTGEEESSETASIHEESKDLELKIKRNDSGEILFVRDEEGYCYKAEKGILKVSSGFLVILKGDKRNGLYVFKYDFTRKVWVYLLKSKDQAFESFKAWKLLVENKTFKKVKVLRTDNGLEFCKEDFNKFCSDNNIERHMTMRPSSLKHLRVFGCAAYAHHSKGKLEPRSLRGVFLGYPLGVKGYIIWLGDQKGFKVIISRDVIFDEATIPCYKNGDLPFASGLDLSKDVENQIQVKISSPPLSHVSVHHNPTKDDEATHSDGSHQVEENQNQPKIDKSLAS